MNQLDRNNTNTEQAYAYAAQLRAKGYSPSETQKIMHQKLNNEPAVMAIPADIQRKEIERVHNTAMKSMFMGLIWLLAGIALTMIVYAASSGVKAYMLPYTAYFIGIIYLVKAQIEKL